MSEITDRWIQAVDHIQVNTPELEDAALFFYSKILGLIEIAKPETAPL
jgi:hypothetical protein